VLLIKLLKKHDYLIASNESENITPPIGGIRKGSFFMLLVSFLVTKADYLPETILCLLNKLILADKITLLLGDKLY
jgi:hypothetical protein